MRNTLLCLALLALAAPAVAGTGPCTVFYDRNQFDAFNQGEGKLLDGIETFEESNIPPYGKQFLEAPLDQNPNTFFGIGFPNGLAQRNLAIWDNATPGPNPPDLNPSGSMFALYVIGVGFYEATSNKVGSDLFLTGQQASLDLVFGAGGYSVSVSSSPGSTSRLAITSACTTWPARRLRSTSLLDPPSLSQ